MKKLYILTALLAFTALANAQTVTEANLKGKWQLTAMDFFGVFVDLDTEKITVSDKACDILMLPKEQIEQDVKAKIDKLKDNYVVFGSNSIVKYKMLEQTEEITEDYSLTKSGNEQLLNFYGNDEGKVFFKDKLLYHVISQENLVVTFIFKKAEN